MDVNATRSSGTPGSGTPHGHAHVSRRPHGFTLVELLVVIGIIAVLVSLLLPSLNRARQSADAVKCLSNLRQIGMACQSYMNESKGVLPPVSYNKFFDNHWYNQLILLKHLQVPMDKSLDSVLFCPSGVPDVQTDLFANPPSQLVDLGYGVFPGSDANQNYASNYAANGYLSSGAAWWDATKPYSEWFPFVWWNPTAAIKPRAAKLFGVKKSDRIPLVFDGLWAHGLNANRFTRRHGNVRSGADYRSCNVVFLDGHAAPMLGGQLPLPADNSLMFDRPTLNTDNKGKWEVTLIVKPVP